MYWNKKLPRTNAAAIQQIPPNMNTVPLRIFI